MPAGRQLQRFQPYGIQPDIQPEIQSDDVYSLCADVIFRDGGAERIKGLLEVYGAPIFPPEWALFTRDASDFPAWLYASTAGFGWYDGSTHQDVTPTDFIPPTGQNPWSGGVLNSVAFMGSGRFWYWDGAGVMQTLPDWPATLFAATMRPYKFHLIGLTVNDSGTLFEDQVIWSDKAPPGQIPQTWIPAPDNEAGTAELAQTTGAVIDGLQLRQSFIMYKDTSTYIMDYVGGSVVMNVRLLFGGSGILARNCVAELNGMHYVLTDGDLIAHDGQTIESIGEDWVRREIFSRVDGAYLRNSFVVANYSDSEVWFCIPFQGSTYPNVAFVYNTSKKRWGLRQLPYEPSYMAPGQVRLEDAETSWDSDPEAWDTDPSPWDEGAGRLDYYDLLQTNPKANAGVGAFEFVDGDFKRNGENIGAQVEKRAMALGDHERVKTVKAVWLEASGTPGSVLRVQLGATFTPDEDPVYSDPVDFVIGSDRKVDLYATGRYISVLFSSFDDQYVEPWRINSFSLEFEARGLY